MGTCCVAEREQYQIGSARDLCKRNKICGYLNYILDGSAEDKVGVAYTQNQATDLAKALIDGLIELQTQEDLGQKLIAEKLFRDNAELIRKQQLFYHGLLAKLNKKEEQISQSIKSRVYHKIANLKKEKKIDKQWKSYDINCIKNNQYKLLSQPQLDDVVKFEVISDHVHKMGEKIGFKFESIKRESQKMYELIENIMKKYNQQIKSLKYTLQSNEVMKMAQISREACKYYDNGVFILLVYFVQSCRQLQIKKKSSAEIEQLLKAAIQKISKKYPPGEGLSKQNQQLIKSLQELQKKNLSNFKHQQNCLYTDNKQAQVQVIIKEYAEIAEQCKDIFQQLVKSTCLERSVLIKIGLKLYPNNPNQKSLTRIKEKMFIAKDEEVKKDMNGNISQILIRQNNNYGQIIDDHLKDSTTVRFKISDMIRGKCIFLEISDIIETVKSIEQFVKKDRRFQIEEIESRFTNDVPISDVTLKIVINDKIIAELQLTIQNNAASYNFAHKIYQLQRTKVFSKIKIIHNYFQQYKDDFNQHITKSLSLMNSKQKLPSEIKANIKKYFKLHSKNKSFIQIFAKFLQQRKSQIQMPQFVIVVDPQLQYLMLSIFCVVFGVWHKQLSEIFNNALKDNRLSSQLKSVLLSSFFDKFSLAKESEYMQQLGFTKQQLQSKIFMEEFIREYFQIENIFEYTSYNQRVFNRAQQLKQIKFWKDTPSGPIQLRNSRFVVNLIIEQHCLQTITRLRQMFDFYFVTREDKKDTIYNQFSSYYKWIDTQLRQSKSLDQERLLSSQIAIIKSQELLENGKHKQASEILQQARLTFQNKQKLDKVMYCDVLLAECFIKINNKSVQESIIKYTQVIKKAETLGLQLKGALYADVLWRISEYFWAKNNTNINGNNSLLATFTKMAIRQMSRSKGKQFIYALKEKWDQFGQNQDKKTLILENDKIGYVKLYLLGPTSCLYLTIAKWKNLKKLSLSRNDIGNDGCKYLAKGKWDNLTHLDLLGNNIGPKGCEYLSGAKWDNLFQLNLRDNIIGDEGCSHLSNADWLKLTQLNLRNNKIGLAGDKNMIMAKWIRLSKLNLKNNEVDQSERLGLRMLIIMRFPLLTFQWGQIN